MHEQNFPVEVGGPAAAVGGHWVGGSRRLPGGVSWPDTDSRLARHRPDGGKLFLSFSPLNSLPFAPLHLILLGLVPGLMI